MQVNVLIVDDEPQNRELAKVILFKEGYQLYFARNGKEALSVLKSEKIDLILLDLMMPEMDGFTLLEEMKRYALTASKVIILTALSDDESMAQALRLGADGYLQKPYDIVDLKQRIRFALMAKEEESLDYHLIIDNLIATLDTVFSEKVWREIVVEFLEQSKCTLKADMQLLIAMEKEVMTKNYCFELHRLTPSQILLHKLILAKFACQEQLSLEKLSWHAVGKFIP
ncbi:MAG: response regulator [Epsilonproteobacteria bacterium]|nr:response regulator [Campylobacterota bacterium]